MPLEKNKEVLAIGELLWDVLPEEKLLGGAPANFCFRLRSLGTQARVVTRIGKDALGDELITQLSARDLDLSLIQRDPVQATGTVDVKLNAEGNPSFTINKNVAYDYLEPTPELVAASKNAYLIYFGTLVQRTAKTRETVYSVLDGAKDAFKFLDINLRRDCYSEDIIKNSFQRADILKLNNSEVNIVSELFGWPEHSSSDFAKRVISEFGITTVLVSLGEQGVYAINSKGQEVTSKGLSITVADTIGAGDSFAAGFVHKFVSGAELAESCKFGNMMGALAATKKGGMAVFTPEEVQSFVARMSRGLCP